MVKRKKIKNRLAGNKLKILREQIYKLRNSNQDFSYTELAKMLGLASRQLAYYHFNKEKEILDKISR